MAHFLSAGHSAQLARARALSPYLQNLAANQLREEFGKVVRRQSTNIAYPVLSRVVVDNNVTLCIPLHATTVRLVPVSHQPINNIRHKMIRNGVH